MPNDAKLGLVVGVGLVIAVAIVFFRKEAPAADPAASVKQQPPPAQPLSPARTRPVAAQPGIRATTAPIPAEGRCHTVRAGETLFSLAQHYYGDRDKSDLIYQSNRNRLSSPDSLEPGTVLVIPELPGGSDKPPQP
jgi:nucleoid-associated protein YgaU